MGRVVEGVPSGEGGDSGNYTLACGFISFPLVLVVTPGAPLTVFCIDLRLPPVIALEPRGDFPC